MSTMEVGKKLVSLCGSGWDDATIDNILDQALDDCDAEGTVADGAVNPCIAATPACSFEAWDRL